MNKMRQKFFILFTFKRQFCYWRDETKCTSLIGSFALMNEILKMSKSKLQNHTTTTRQYRNQFINKTNFLFYFFLKFFFYLFVLSLRVCLNRMIQNFNLESSTMNSDEKETNRDRSEKKNDSRHTRQSTRWFRKKFLVSESDKWQCDILQKAKEMTDKQVLCIVIFVTFACQEKLDFFFSLIFCRFIFMRDLFHSFNEQWVFLSR